MNLNHLNLPVTDVRAAHDFLERFFGLRSMGAGNAKMMGLNDGAGFSLVLMHVGVEGRSAYPDGFHVGFNQPSPEQVHAIHQRLTEAGFDVPAPRQTHGGTSFYLGAPGGFTIEVSC